MKKFLAGLIIFVLAIIVGWQVRSYYPVFRDGTETWREMIRNSSQEFGVSERLIWAVVANESGGNPQVVSPQGAVGLMQVMPQTARRQAEKLGMKNYTDNDLFIPEINIRLGTSYLAQLSKSFNGDVPLVVAAYNAGPSRVRFWKWFDNGVDSMTVIKSRAYPETAAYVLNVMKEAQNR